MALNDYADRHLDAIERPERPIPSGRIKPETALGVATGLTVGGLGIAAAAGGKRALRVALPLTATVWAYDFVLKSTLLGPVAMAAARALDVLLGAGGAKPAVGAALTVGAHTFAVTVLSQSEVDGAKPALPAAAMAATAGVRVAAGRRVGPLASALLGTYAVTTGRAQYDAVRDPGAKQIRKAVGAGIHGMIPLQAGLIARTGAWRSALAVAAAFPIARALSRKVSPT